jgi:hypothetical protein
MRIRFVAISPDKLARVRVLVEALRNASNAGDMDGMDLATERLQALADEEHSIDLSEDEWREWLAETRTKNPTFQSDYLVSGEVCSRYFPDATSGTMVLQLPVDEREGDDV